MGGASGLGGSEVRHGVRVLGAERDGREIVADIYGTEANICGFIRFRNQGARRRRAQLRTLQRWARLGTELTMTAGPNRTSLHDDLGLRTLQARSDQPS
jgi:hypothetical protein